MLSLGSAVLKIGTFLDMSLVPAKPMEHYIPVKMDLSDLEAQINWAKSNDREAQQIAERGRRLAM